MSGGLYVFAMAYLAAPLMGWHLESASLAAFFGGLPLAVKGGFKFLVSWPFVFHLYNAARHLVWDTTTGIAKASIRFSGWAIWGTSLVTSLGLAFYL
jgi:succinate dehydrogenase (ubiquinone) cytochrome b560 subunit